MITTKELDQFHHRANVKLVLEPTHEWPITVLEESNHNPADPYDCMCLHELVLRANGITED